MPIRVVAAVIHRGRQFLVCERPAHKRHGGLWEFPGGKVEEGESDFAAVARELREELGVSATAVGPVDFSVADPGSDFRIEFLRVEIEGEPQPLEHASLLWVTQEEVLALPLAPSDLRYVRWRGAVDVASGIPGGATDPCG
jgi:8-oxo-dGTP diphosphatase